VHPECRCANAARIGRFENPRSPQRCVLQPPSAADHAVCGQTKCFAPEWAIVNYLEKKLSRSDYLSLRNEYFDDVRGQRTGTKTKYTEHMSSWGHWFGTTILLRPEIRYEHSYHLPADDGGAKEDQFIFAGDVILKY